MEPLEFQQLARKVLDQQKNPKTENIEDAIILLRNFPMLVEAEIKEKHPLDFALRYKSIIDRTTWSFSQMFSLAQDVPPEKLIDGYQALLQINEMPLADGSKFQNIDYDHCGEFSSPLDYLARLSLQAGQTKESQEYSIQENKRISQLKKSDEAAKRGIDLLINSAADLDTAKSTAERTNLAGLLEKAVFSFQESLHLNPYNTTARIVWGFLETIETVAQEINESFNKRRPFPDFKESLSAYTPGGIPLFVPSSENAEREVRFNFGSIFQRKYYLSANPCPLEVIFTYQKFTESNNQVFRYERVFSPELTTFMNRYAQLFKHSAFKVYGKEELAQQEEQGIKLASELDLKVPVMIRSSSYQGKPVREFNLIHGQSIYELFRELEKGDYSEEFRVVIENVLVDKHLAGLTRIQKATAEMKRIFPEQDISNYQEKLRRAFEEERDDTGESGGLICLMKEHFGIKINFPNSLDTLGKKLNDLAEKREDLVIYKDASPRNTKLDYLFALEELGLRAEFEKTKKEWETVPSYLQEKYKRGLNPRKIAAALSQSLYQLDFEKINRLGFEFDDVIETIEFPFFNPLRQGEDVCDKKYRYFLSLKGKAGQAEELKKNYHLVALNRHVRWMYYLMKWYDREVGISPSHAQEHKEDFKVHLKIAQRTISLLPESFQYHFEDLNILLDYVKKTV